MDGRKESLEDPQQQARVKKSAQDVQALCHQLGAPRGEEDVLEITNQVFTELKRIAELPGLLEIRAPRAEVPESTSSGSTEPARPKRSSRPRTKKSDGPDEPSDPDPDPHFPEVSPDGAEDILRKKGGNIYSITTPPNARGVWIGRWANIVDAYGHRAVGEQASSVTEALRAFATDSERVSAREGEVNVRIRLCH